MQAAQVLVVIDANTGTYKSVSAGSVTDSTTPSVFALGTTLASIASTYGVSFGSSIRLIQAYINPAQTHYI